MKIKSLMEQSKNI